MSKQNKTEEEEEEFGYVLYAMFKYMGLIVFGMWAFVIFTTYGNV